jgi:excisionase family DNA binding protein
MENQKSEYYSVREFSEKMGVPKRTVYDWMDSDPPEIPNTKIGRRKFIPKKEVEELLKSKMKLP